jgi:mRNA-degrading endonuclease YafQ of YafQ-DinJ toxin-antitoxin module
LKYVYKASEQYWKNFYGLSASQKASARYAWGIFKEDPFDPRLKTHKIHRLSAEAKRTIRSVWIEDDLRVVFYIVGNTVFTVDIGTHAMYLD